MKEQTQSQWQIALQEQISDAKITVTCAERLPQSLIFGTGKDCIEYRNLPPAYRLSVEAKPSPTSYIRVEIWLPDAWNGRFFGTGNGGSAGNISYFPLVDGIKRGYASANTDMGTSRMKGGEDNREMWLDYGFRSTHLMTVIGKTAALLHYEKTPDKAFYIGASTGGQQAMSEVQRYPEDYDGVIAGVPAFNRTNLHAYFLWNLQTLRMPAGQWLIDADTVERIHGAVLRFFSQLEKSEQNDYCVCEPFLTEAQTRALLAFVQRECHLNTAQTDALRKLYGGPVCSDGRRVYNGFPFGAERDFPSVTEYQHMEDSAFFFDIFRGASGKDFKCDEFDFDRDMKHYHEAMAPVLNANNPDIVPFRDRGGKLLMYSGAADPCVPAADAVRYYEDVIRTFGSRAAVLPFFRYFLIPGMPHTATCTSVWLQDLLPLIEAWSDKGTAPDELLYYRRSVPSDPDSTVTVRRALPYPDGMRSAHTPPLAVCNEFFTRI